MIVYTVQVSAYAPTGDSHGRRDGWEDPREVEVYGWAPTGAMADNQPIDGNRRPVLADREVYPVTEAGRPRSRWTFPDGTFEQVGRAADYSTGPWWTEEQGAVVVYLRRTEG